MKAGVKTKSKAKTMAKAKGKVKAKMVSGAKRRGPNPFRRARKRMQLMRAIAEMKASVKSVGLVQERARFVSEARKSPQRVCEFLEGMHVPKIEALEDYVPKGKKSRRS